MIDSTFRFKDLMRTVKTKTAERREKLMKIDEYAAASKREPDNPEIWLARSVYHIRNLEYAAALAAVNRCIELEPQEPDYYGERALMPVYKAAYFDTDDRLEKKDVLDYLRQHPDIHIPVEKKMQMMKDLQAAAGPFSVDQTFKEIYRYLRSVDF
jgi:hypothetical protein